MEALASDGAITVTVADVWKIEARAIIGDEEEPVDVVLDLDAGHAIMLVGERTLTVPVGIPDGVQRVLRDTLNGARLEVPQQPQEEQVPEDNGAE